MMTRKKWIAVATCALVVLAAALWGTGLLTDSGPEPAVARAAPGAAPQVGALGRIEPRSEIINIGAAADEWVAELLVENGGGVTKGQVLGRLKSHAEYSAARERIAAQISEAERLIKAVTQSGEAAVREAELKLRSAQEVYPLRISSQEARIKRAEAELANNEEILAYRRQLLASQMQARRDVDNQAALVRQIRADLDRENEDLGRLKKEMQIERMTAEASLLKAKADLGRSQLEIRIESLRKDLAVATARAEAATLVSPVEGRILKIHRKPGERVGDGPILTMGDTREMHAVAEVYETDIGRVRLGQQATVSSPTLGKPMRGKVVRIGHMIFKNDVLNVDPAARVDARVVEVRVLLEEGARVADLSNLSVDVVIHTGQAPAADR